MFSRNIFGQRGGFTLVELLVVISIIGLLASVVLASLNTARMKARDVQRKTAINQVKTAMELYYNSNGSYPTTGAADNTGSALSGLATPLLPYISSIPVDPQGATWFTYAYVRGLPGTNSYGIRVRYEQAGYSGADASGYCRTGVNMSAGWWGSPACSN